ncbi:MAG TPA: aldose epimerase family protein [Spirochaetia bacterium]|nr:aldose epimerase family protein [Spirochaetia bacterium]
MKPHVSLITPQDATGAPLYLISHGPMEVVLSGFGAAIRSIRIPDAQGKVEEVTQGWDSDAAWQHNGPYFGVSVGRYANRIAGATFTLDGKVYPLEANDGPNHLHGGKLGFHQQIWSSEPFETELDAGVVFKLVSPDGQDGYPGRVEVSARISLTDRYVIKTVYEAVTDKPTPLNLTNHTYFNLGGPDHESILDHQFWSAAAEWLPVGPGAIPTGEVKSVADSPFDFRVPKLLGRDYSKVEGGYDHCLVLEAKNRPLGSVREAARASLPNRGRTLKLYTDQSGFQLYTGNFLGGVAGRNGKILKPTAAFCLESQRFPDSVAQPGWAPAVLRPGETYRHEFHYAFEF